MVLFCPFLPNELYLMKKKSCEKNDLKEIQALSSAWNLKLCCFQNKKTDMMIQLTNIMNTLV